MKTHPTRSLYGAVPALTALVAHSIASGGVGASTFLAGAMFLFQGGVKMRHPSCLEAGRRHGHAEAVSTPAHISLPSPT